MMICSHSLGFAGLLHCATPKIKKTASFLRALCIYRSMHAIRGTRLIITPTLSQACCALIRADALMTSAFSTCARILQLNSSVVYQFAAAVDAVCVSCCFQCYMQTRAHTRLMFDVTRAS